MEGMSIHRPARQPAGTPVGGQFAAQSRPAPEMTLADAGCNLLDHVAAGAHGQDDYLDAVAGDLPDLDVYAHEADLFSPAALALADGRTQDAEDLLAIASRLDERERGWHHDEHFTEPVIGSQAGDDHYGDWRVGSRYDPYAQPKQIAMCVRTDIADAVAAGYLPGGVGVTYRVTSGNTRGDRRVTIQARGLNDDEMLYVIEGPDGRPEWTPTAYARMIDQRLQDLGRQYTRSRIATEHDYANVSTWVEVSMQTRFQDTHRAYVTQVRSGSPDAQTREAWERAKLDRAMIAAMHGYDVPESNS